MTHVRALFLFVLVIFAMPAYASAATFVVDTTVDAGDTTPGDGTCATASGSCSLRAAVEEASASAGPDVIRLSAGVYVLSSAGIVVGDAVTIEGAGADVTTIDAAQAGYAFWVTNATIRDVAIRNAPSVAIVAEGTLLLERSSLHDNGYGITGVACDGSSTGRCFGPVTLVDSTLRKSGGIGDPGSCEVILIRSAITESGGFFALSGGYFPGGAAAFTLEDSVVDNNSGGIAFGGRLGGGVRVTRSSISHNTWGGIVYQGLSIGGGPGILVQDSTIEDNSGLGGIHAPSRAAAIKVTGGTIAGNHSTEDGGGIAAYQDLTILNSTISGNSSDGYGGGISSLNYLYGPIADVTITGNVADADGNGVGSGGGIAVYAYLDDQISSVTRTIIAGNVDRSGVAPDCAGSIASSGWNLIGDPSGCTIAFDAIGNLIGVDPRLAPLEDNGGPTRTHALLADSPAIDGGGACATATDQRGVARPQGGACDIGAYESACGNGTVDLGETCDDGNTIDGDCCSSRCRFDASDTACSDGDACTTGDACDGAGKCAAGSAVDCGPCKTCEPGGGCVASVLSDCRRSVERFSGELLVADGAMKKLKWLWSKGEATAPAEFGDPLGGDAVSLCVFDESGPMPELVFGAATRSAGCGAKPCWKRPSATQLQYKDGDRTRDELDSVLLKSGPDAKARVLVSAKGAALAVPILPLHLPLRVQLQAASGRCWEAQYFENGVRRNDATQFAGRAFRP